MKKLLIALLLAFGLSGFHSGNTAKNFTLKNLANKKMQLKDYLAEGPVLLDFWATWCKPCIKAFPKLEATHKKYSPRGFNVVAINNDSPRNQSKIKPFLKSLKVSFPVLLDPKNTTMRDFGVMVMPTSVLLSKEGEILHSVVGYKPEQYKILERLIEEQLAGEQK